MYLWGIRKNNFLFYLYVEIRSRWTFPNTTSWFSSFFRSMKIRVVLESSEKLQFVKFSRQREFFTLTCYLFFMFLTQSCLDILWTGKFNEKMGKNTKFAFVKMCVIITTATNDDQNETKTKNFFFHTRRLLALWSRVCMKNWNWKLSQSICSSINTRHTSQANRLDSCRCRVKSESIADFRWRNETGSHIEYRNGRENRNDFQTLWEFVCLVDCWCSRCKLTLIDLVVK